MFLGFVGEEVGEIPAVDDDPGAAWDAARSQLQAALDDPARADTEFDGFLGRSTLAAAVDRFLNCDLVIHRWDLARATGQDATIDPADAERVLEVARGASATSSAARARSGRRSPSTPRPSIATRMLAFCGRPG